MAHAVPILERYEFTESEIASAQILPDLLLKYCKTQLAMESMRARNIKPPPDQDGYSKFIQEKAEIDGAIGVWEFLINGHEETVNRLTVV